MTEMKMVHGREYPLRWNLRLIRGSFVAVLLQIECQRQKRQEPGECHCNPRKVSGHPLMDLKPTWFVCLTSAVHV
jgi:hypothetical protein